MIRGMLSKRITSKKMVTFAPMNIRGFVVTLFTFFASAGLLEAQSPERTEREKRDFRDAVTATGAVFSNVQRYFIDTVNLSKLNNLALNGMLQQLDPYTEYMDEKDAKSFMEATDGTYAGIGAVIAQQAEGTVVVNELMEGLAADKAGLRPGDRFLRIDGKDFSNSTTPQVSQALRGKIGSRIEVVVARKSSPKPLTFSFLRESISINPVAYSGRISNDIGIIRLTSFTRDTGEEVRDALRHLAEEGELKGLILDLRSNGGGVLQSAVELLSLFVPKATTVVTVRGRSAQSNADYRTTNDPLFPTLPMVVLINEESASASEIVAGALQDLDRAVVMGRRSFGKGLVQSTVPLPNGALLKLTTAQYFIPSGRNIQKITYTHLNESADQASKPETDSVSTPYYTLAGREVFSSDGIFPDVKTIPDTIPAIVGFIAIDSLSMDFVEEYVATHPKPSSPKDFHLSDEEYDAFCRYLIDRGFKYRSGSAFLLEKLEEQLALEKKADFASGELQNLQKAIEPDLAIELSRYQEHIRQYLEGRLVLRYFYRHGAFAHSLPLDKEVRQAVTLLLDADSYRKILTPNQKEHN